MTIKRLSIVPNDFPGADIYLDDIAEIISILKSHEGEGDQPAIQIIIGDEGCDSLEDLSKIGERIGGRIKQLTLRLDATSVFISNPFRVVFQNRPGQDSTSDD